MCRLWTSRSNVKAAGGGQRAQRRTLHRTSRVRQNRFSESFRHIRWYMSMNVISGSVFSCVSVCLCVWVSVCLITQLFVHSAEQVALGNSGPLLQLTRNSKVRRLLQ